MGSIQTFIDRMRYWCDVADLGYDQSNRLDFEDGGECDCASLVIHALQEAGFDTGDATYTGNMASELIPRGWSKVANDGNPLPGDILLNVSDHVAVWLGDCLAQASIDENGDISGGHGGDQSGWETNTHGYYNYPWNFYLRWTGGSDYDGGDGSQDEHEPTSGAWQGELIGTHDTTNSGDDFAGVLGRPMLMIAANVGEYQAHVMGGAWLPTVSQYDPYDTEYGCAGDFAPIDAVRVYDDDIWYQTHNLGGDWNEPMHGLTDTSGYGDDFAGCYGVAQDAIRMWREDGKQPIYNVFC